MTSWRELAQWDDHVDDIAPSCRRCGSLLCGSDLVVRLLCRQCCDETELEALRAWRSR